MALNVKKHQFQFVYGLRKRLFLPRGQQFPGPFGNFAIVLKRIRFALQFVYLFNIIVSGFKSPGVSQPLDGFLPKPAHVVLHLNLFLFQGQSVHKFNFFFPHFPAGVGVKFSFSEKGIKQALPVCQFFYI